MTKRSAFDLHFGLEMQRLTRRVERLQALRDGRAIAREVHVRSTIVKRHVRAAYTRTTIIMRKP